MKAAVQREFFFLLISQHLQQQKNALQEGPCVDLIAQELELKISSSKKKELLAELENFLENQEKIDEFITPHLKENWRLENIFNLERILVEIALYEVLFKKSISKAIAIDEVLRLAHKYAQDKSPQFINGILDKILSTSEAS